MVHALAAMRLVPLQPITVKNPKLDTSWPTRVGPRSENAAVKEYIMPVHWPSRRCSDSESNEATQAGGRPMTVPDTMPNMMTKVRAVARLLVRGQNIRMKIEESAVEQR